MLMVNWDFSAHAAQKLATAFKLSEMRNISNGNLQIGVLDRKNKRHLNNAAQLTRSLTMYESNDKNSTHLLSAHYQLMEGLQLVEQLAWVHSQDIIIAVHGAGNVNFMSLRKCTSVLEVYPPKYFPSGYYSPLVHFAGGLPYTLIAVPKATVNAQYMAQKTKNSRAARKAARDVPVPCDSELIVQEILPVLIRAREECLNGAV
jgi:hypothetical protein